MNKFGGHSALPSRVGVDALWVIARKGHALHELPVSSTSSKSVTCSPKILTTLFMWSSASLPVDFPLISRELLRG